MWHKMEHSEDQIRQNFVNKTGFKIDQPVSVWKFPKTSSHSPTVEDAVKDGEAELEETVCRLVSSIGQDPWNY